MYRSILVSASGVSVPEGSRCMAIHGSTDVYQGILAVHGSANSDSPRR